MFGFVVAVVVCAGCNREHSDTIGCLIRTKSVWGQTMWFCVVLDLTWQRVVISSVHKSFEKHAYDFGLKEREKWF